MEASGMGILIQKFEVDQDSFHQQYHDHSLVLIFREKVCV